MSVWFASPARSFHESCPLGNGRLGAMDFGGVGVERIVLNESSMWSGGPYDSNLYGAYKCLPELRSKLLAGDISAAIMCFMVTSATPPACAGGTSKTSSAATRRWAI